MTSNPFPATGPASQPEEEQFYEGLLAGEIRVPWCTRCDGHVWRPKSHCTTCYEPVSQWRTLAGTGEVYSYCVIHKWEGAFAELGPYVLAWVRLDGGPTILANVAGPPEDARIGRRLRLVVPHETDRRRRGPVFVSQ
jgi:uncharacterized OB-fold protein